ncbi:MAG TPA: archaeosortase/exosortase family protein [Verrucomicrobiales bacterium]|jgi:hypothetical protein|nr:archaeosortase/exosortase family protein [Verrucomicrobiales bacterium]
MEEVSARPNFRLLHLTAVTALCFCLAVCLIYFYAFFEWSARPYQSSRSVLGWLSAHWTHESYTYRHGWLILLVMLILLYRAAMRSRNEPSADFGKGLLWLIAGLFCLWSGVRIGMLTPAAASLPLVVMGGIQFGYGWKRARHFIFPLSLFVFLIPVEAVEEWSRTLGVFSKERGQAVHDLLTGQMGSGWKPAWGRVGFGHRAHIDYFLLLILTGYLFIMVPRRFLKARVILFAFLIPIVISTDALGRIFAEVLLRYPNASEKLQQYWDWAPVLQVTLAFCLFLALSVILRLTGRRSRSIPEPVR